MASIKSDHYTLGFFVGAIAGAAADLINFILTKILRLGKIGYEDFAAVLVFGRLSTFAGQSIFAHLVQLFFSALIGVLFVFWIKQVTRGFLIFKGITFGLFVWFLAFTVAQLFKVQFLHRMDFMSVIVNIFAAVVYGAMLALVLGWFLREN